MKRVYHKVNEFALFLLPVKVGFDETTRFCKWHKELGNVWSSFLMKITQIFGTLRQISRSHVISRFRPDLLPSLHKVTQMRHTFRQKTLILSLLELPVEDYAHFYMPGT